MFSLAALLDVGYTYLNTRFVNTTKFNFIKNQKGKHFDYVFVGSSRVINDINAKIVDSCLKVNSVNFGIMDARPKDILTVLKLLQLYEIKYDSVFIQTDYYYNSSERSNFLYIDMMPFIREDISIKNYYEEEGDFLLLYYCPFYRFCKNDSKLGVRELLASLRRKNQFEESKGFVSLYGFGDKWQRTLPDTITEYNKYNKQILKFLRDNKIKSKFFVSPFRNDTQNLGFIQLLSGKYPGLWDFSKSIPDDTKFKNGYHLNERGAKEFSIIMSHKIKSER
ncbi:hypothetical protein [Flavobacterium sp. N502540]|uniref:hypothetical protein n=1 Tax=Flavobacterium sp. N502540 TaxID=2986838 RepID=UPI0022243BB9|nr:hypothetical protein [Flavobacterium sp. N502540]